MKDIINQIGNNIKEQRKKTGLTQAELAEKINVDPKYISRLETGTSTPSITTVIRISQILKTDISNFFATESLEKRNQMTNSIVLKLSKANIKELRTIFDMVSLIVDR